MKLMKSPCGYCNTGAHDRCPTAVRNGDGTPRICPCCQDVPPKCLDCKNTRPGEVSEETRVCVDRTACADEQARKRETGPLAKFLREQAERAIKAELTSARVFAKIAALPSAPPPVTAKQCRCCGAPTKGGKFLPGHDSRYLSQLATEVQGLIDAGDRPEEIADTKRRVLAALDDTPALRAKLEKRI